MPNPPTLDIKTYIATLSSTLPPIYVGSGPIQGNYPYAVFTDSPGGYANPRWLRDNNRFVVNVFGAVNDYMNGWNTAQLIKDLLLGCKPFNQSNVSYIRIVMISDITFLNFNKEGSPVFSMTMEVTREYPESGTNRDPIS